MILVELDPIGPDGQPSSTTVWCPACESVYRVPFANRHSTVCGCLIRRYAIAALYDFSRERPNPDGPDVPTGQLCEWVRVGRDGRRIPTAELERAKAEKLAQRPVYSPGMEEGNLCERCGGPATALFFASLDNKLICNECRKTEPRSLDDHAPDQDRARRGEERARPLGTSR